MRKKKRKKRKSPLFQRSPSDDPTGQSSSLARDGLSEAAALEQAADLAAPAAPTTGATGPAAAGDSALAVVPLSADRRGGAFGSALDGGISACYG